MSKTCIGIVTFGNADFTKLTVAEIQRTTKSNYEIFIVVGKPEDKDTRSWLSECGIPNIQHNINRGFPASINDIYDHAWVNGDFDYVIICGNDVVPYPNGVDALIEEADETDWEWFCSSQFDSQSLCRMYPGARRLFHGPGLKYTDFTARPWDLHNDIKPRGIEPDVIKDVRNLALFKRSVFDKLGYADANFWPGGYYEDNDYCRRARVAGVRGCGLPHSAYFHFWSRTIHQETGSTTGIQFKRNGDFYRFKWGGEFDHEVWDKPFGGIDRALCDGVVLPGAVKIESRGNEDGIIKYWSSLGR